MMTSQIVISRFMKSIDKLKPSSISKSTKLSRQKRTSLAASNTILVSGQNYKRSSLGKRAKNKRSKEANSGA